MNIVDAINNIVTFLQAYGKYILLEKVILEL